MSIQVPYSSFFYYSNWLFRVFVRVVTTCSLVTRRQSLYSITSLLSVSIRLLITVDYRLSRADTPSSWSSLHTTTWVLNLFGRSIFGTVFTSSIQESSSFWLVTSIIPSMFSLHSTSLRECSSTITRESIRFSLSLSIVLKDESTSWDKVYSLKVRVQSCESDS